VGQPNGGMYVYANGGQIEEELLEYRRERDDADCDFR
jgi:hypothetical protein